MRIGITYDLREDYGISEDSSVFADFCQPSEIAYLAEAIRECGWEPVSIGNMHKLYQWLRTDNPPPDLVFATDEGILSRNREAIVPALLELAGIPCIGSDAYAMGLSQNKYHTKLAARQLGLHVPDCLYVPHGQEKLEAYLHVGMKQNKLEFPVVVKPNCEGYSMGVGLARSPEELAEQVRWNMEQYQDAVLCEAYIRGEEVYVPVVGTGADAYALGIGACKYEDGSSIDIFSLGDKCFRPIRDEAASFGAATDRSLQEQALSVHRHLQCRDLSRSDFKVDEAGKAWFLEVNPRPGLTPGGPFETCARAAGKTYAGVIDEIVRSAAARCGLLSGSKKE